MEVTAPLATDRPPQVGECAGVPFLMTPMVQVPQGTTQPLVRRRALAPRFAGPTAARIVREAKRIDGGQARAVPNGLPCRALPKGEQVRLLDSEAQAEVPPPDRDTRAEAAGIVCTFTDRQRVGRVVGPRRGSLWQCCRDGRDKPLGQYVVQKRLGDHRRDHRARGLPRSSWTTPPGGIRMKR